RRPPHRHRDRPRPGDQVAGGPPRPRPPRAGRTPPAVWALAAGCLLLPLAVAGPDLRTAVQVPALAIVLLSLVVVTGRAGQIALGQAAYAGLGALFTALLTAAGLPPLAALALAVPLAGAAGLLTAGPAIRRHGLALALATLAVGVAVSRFVLAQPYATAGLPAPTRPAPFTTDRAYYVLELLLLAAALLLVAGLRRGRTGRALAALRDHERAAEAAGVAATRLKLLAFALAAALAGLGGGLLAMGTEAFDPTAYDPLRGLLWFAAVVTLGADHLLTPLLAAPLLLTLDTAGPAGAAALLIGLLAARTPRLPPLTTLLTRPRTPRTSHAPHAPHPPPAGDGPAPPRTGTRTRPPPPSHPPPRLRAEGLWFAHPGGVTALRGVGIVLPGAQVTAVVGPNGAGKSTLFDCLAGAARPRRGRVLLDGEDITGRPAHVRARRGIARTFQQPAVFPSLSVEENVRVGADRTPDPAAATERALRLTGLAGPLRALSAGDLPTGVLRRVELARALAGRPHTLLLDEPAAGLDTAETEALSRLLAALAADGLTVLVVEHDRDVVAAVARTVHTMAGGRLGP
ncbi:ATP-binding cassette domain-containing protein, partial [Streptomyces sp. NPDC059762]|uniref:ABC transporter permease subunit n=1 Tax=Streptomyces sp. NPDC059762 TaxID=3346938 RepID=UPI00366661D1